MSLLLTMLPVYLFGNLHCLGMCGPLVMMIGHHRFRYFYFLGRLLSFTMAGMIAGAIGAVADAFLKQYHFSELTSFFFGGIIIMLGVLALTGLPYPGQEWMAKRLAKINKSLSMLMLLDRAWPAFLFGFFTLALPCGQTLIVFSACALSADIAIGMINGFAFALLTSPSLFLAMKVHGLLKQARGVYQILIGLSALVVGVLALLRGMAEMGLITHWVVNPDSPSHYHIVLF